MRATETSTVTRESRLAQSDFAAVKTKQRAKRTNGSDLFIGYRFMKQSSIALAFALVAVFAATAHAAEQGVLVNAGDLKWGDAPPVLPKGAKVAVLNGDPFKPGQYTLRLSLPANYSLPPHWHTATENLTIVSGTFYIGMGDKAVAKDVHELKSGGYHYLPAKQHHYAFTKSATVVQVSGEGPFDINYIDSKDNPAGAN
jgi:ChrR-like protein with cupin domain